MTFAAVIIIVLDGRWLINSNVPASPKDYIHRVGRIARAGRGGMVITLVTQYDVERLKLPLIQSLWSLKPMKMKCCHYSEQ